jgi:hypothetical protein
MLIFGAQNFYEGLFNIFGSFFVFRACEVSCFVLREQKASFRANVDFKHMAIAVITRQYISRQVNSPVHSNEFVDIPTANHNLIGK